MHVTGGLAGVSKLVFLLIDSLATPAKLVAKE